jgi:hypothetical protein
MRISGSGLLSGKRYRRRYFRGWYWQTLFLPDLKTTGSEGIWQLSFEFAGGYGVLNLTMKVKQEGNFP